MNDNPPKRKLLQKVRDVCRTRNLSIRTEKACAGWIRRFVHFHLGDVVRTRRPRRLPVALTCNEVATLLNQLDSTNRLVASLLYGSGLRLTEALRL